MTDEVRAVAPVEWHSTVETARSEGFHFFDLLTAVDREAEGFEVVVRLWDVDRRTGLVVRTTVARSEPALTSITDLYGGAAWHERATAELFGIRFEGHDTTPLLLSPTFEGHPLRKDFVLASRAVKRWPGTKEPGESDADLATPRRRPTPPGVPKDWVKP